MKTAKLPKQRNWVAKNNHNRAAVFRDRTQYQRHAKHKKSVESMTYSA